MTEPMPPIVPPGQHLLIDFWGARYLTDQARVEKALRDAAVACDATLLKIMLHGFGEGAGITGVAILAESHISIHTWPELGYAALDIFMCGACDPHKALPCLRAHFEPRTESVTTHHRGSLTAQTNSTGETR